MRRFRSGIAPLVALAVSVACHTGCPTSEEPDPEPPAERDDFPYITDDQGRVLILHGMNFMGSSKHSEGHMPPVDEAVLDRFGSEWGFNVSRFLIFWDLLEPSPGEINADYLDDIEHWMDLHRDAGVFVVLDMHQDVYAERFCCDGAPEWAIRDDGEPFELQSQWFANYFQPAVQRSFDNFWLYEDGDHADLQDHYLGVWQAVAARFADHPAVLGYDIMNEPHPGTMIDPVELLGEENPGSPHIDFDEQHFQPFYQRMIEGIRGVDDDGWIFFEPRYGAPGTGTPSYMGVLTDPRPEGNRLVYAPHLYSLSFEVTHVYDAEGDPTLPNWEQHRAAEMAAQDCPLLLGEWGFDSSWENADQAYVDVLQMADRISQGWTYWSMDPGGWGMVDADWNEKAPADRLVHPYPQRIAGVPLSYGYDHGTRVMHVEFGDREGVSGSTEIYLASDRHYPDGYEVWCSDAEDSWSTVLDTDRDVLEVETTPGDAPHRVEIRPAP